MVENTACVQVPVDLPRRHGLRPLSTITDEGEQADEVRDRFPCSPLRFPYVSVLLSS
jgi:hypothetical protein